MMNNVKIFSITMTMSDDFMRLSKVWTSALEYYNLFSRVKLNIKSSFVIPQGCLSITMVVVVLVCFNAKTIFKKKCR